MPRATTVLLAILIALIPAGASAVGAPRTRSLPSRDGDNTIYLTWDAGAGQVTQASSSRRVTANQPFELLTRLMDRTGAIVMRASFKNISKHRSIRFDGRLVHRVTRDGAVQKEFVTRVFHTVLKPGDKIVGRFSYFPDSGDYSTRTDYERTKH